MSKQPAKTVPGIVELIDKTCKELNISSQKITSGAYHDALSMAKMADIGMIFVPSVNGVSHAPKSLRILRIFIGKPGCCARCW